MTMANKTLIAISGMALLLMSCFSKQNKEYFKWGAAVCQPANYAIGAPKVFFYSEGGLILNTGSPLYDSSWGYPDDIHNSHAEMPLPDSVYVSYESINVKNETWSYEGGAKLPNEILLELFKKGYKEENLVLHPEYITAGLAPGGRVCIWAGPVEVIRFTVLAAEKLNNKPMFFASQMNENTNYLKHHPIDYSYWEKPDERYGLDFGFCSQNSDIVFFNSSCCTKEGLVYSPSDYYTETIDWDASFGKIDKDIMKGYIQYGDSTDHKLPLPVHMVFEWKNKVTEVFYSTDVVMPKDLPQRFERSYIDPKTGRTEHFNRIVLGVEKDGKHAILWLDGPGKREKFMSFKGLKEKEDGDQTVESGGYAKNVVYY